MAKSDLPFYAELPDNKAPNCRSADLLIADPAVLGGRFELRALIGKGSTGSVFRAHDLRTGTSCAIKMLSSAASADEEECARFANEATVISQIFHPNIVEIREFRRDEAGRPFLVMELLDGMDLHTYLQNNGILPLERVQHIVRQVASALHAVHGLGIVHRDIKPRNIFLARQRADVAISTELVKVVDFGLSKIIGGAQHQTAVGIILGTPEYLAPEGTLGRSRLIEERTDQWALAATAFRMLSGRLPFEDEDVIRLMLRIRQDATPSLSALAPRLPKYVTQAIERGLSKRKEDRFPTIREFARAVCGELGGLSGGRTRASLTACPVLVPAEISKPTAGKPSVRPDPLEATRAIKQSTLERLISQVQAGNHRPEPQSSPEYSVHVEVGQSSETGAPGTPHCVAAQHGSSVRAGERRFRLVTLLSVLTATGLGAAGWVVNEHRGRAGAESDLAATSRPHRPTINAPPTAAAPTVQPPSQAVGESTLPMMSMAASQAEVRTPTQTTDYRTAIPEASVAHRSRALAARSSRSGKNSIATQRLPSGPDVSPPGRSGAEPAAAVASALPPAREPPTPLVVATASDPEEPKVASEPARVTSLAPVAVVQPELDTSLTPRAIFSPQPELPSSVRLAVGRQPLDATYLLYITTEGRVSAVDSVRAIPLGDDSIVRTLRLWRYPARKKPLSLQVDFHFPGY